MRLLALTAGTETRASTFFRIQQYVPALGMRGIHVELQPARAFKRWSEIPAYDAVLLQKALIRTGKLRRIRRLSRRLVFDVDDAIWHPHGKRSSFFREIRKNFRLKAIARMADLCTVANNVLASHMKTLSARVTVIPMALDEYQWTFRKVPAMQNEIRIGWSGHPANSPSLEQLEPVLLDVQKLYPQVKVAVFSGQKPQFQRLQIVHIPFASGSEAEAVRTFDIGLVPLPTDSFSLGKSPIKALQYMASGAAVVATPVGAAQEFFTETNTALYANSLEEWKDALRKLIENPSLRREMTLRGRRVFEEHFTVDAMTSRLAEALTGRCVER